MDWKDNIRQWLTNGAVISSTPGRLLLGWGGQQRVAWTTNTVKKTSFYFPDFFLQDQRPWFQYEHMQEIDTNDLFQLLSEEKSELNYCNPTYTWKSDHHSLFCCTFDDLMRKMAAGELDKAVPFVFENSSVTMTSSQLIHSLCNALKYAGKYPVYLYGFWNQHEGMIGLTPEILFQYREGRQLQTMACAGTSRKEDCSREFLSDPKQAHEHQLVVKGIYEALTPFGNVHVGKKQLLSLPNINHLVTPITVDLASIPNFDEIVRVLHPTPALGAFPRAPGMHWLESYQQLINRGRFGAPAGYLNEDGTAACYVAIRNIQWDQSKMLIGAGCGVVPASQCDNEWAEINLKLKAIKEMFGL